MKLYIQEVRGCIDCPNKETFGCTNLECRCKKIYTRNNNYRLVHESDYAIRDAEGRLRDFGYPEWCPLEDMKE